MKFFIHLFYSQEVFTVRIKRLKSVGVVKIGSFQTKKKLKTLTLKKIKKKIFFEKFKNNCFRNKKIIIWKINKIITVYVVI